MTGEQIGPRTHLPIPSVARTGLITYDAKDPVTSYPPIERLRPPDGATPLALTGAYTGGTAFGRFLETSRLWTDTTEPGAMRPGGVGRRSAVFVRILHSI
ncbi:MAG: hypothetical protein QOJ56_4866, partial [Mycobacterium sp.]|nr:hypothetical protein [Mycobacterium sp.]